MWLVTLVSKSPPILQVDDGLTWICCSSSNDQWSSSSMNMLFMEFGYRSYTVVHSLSIDHTCCIARSYVNFEVWHSAKILNQSSHNHQPISCHHFLRKWSSSRKKRFVSENLQKHMEKIHENPCSIPDVANHLQDNKPIYISSWWFGTFGLFVPSYWECRHPNWRTPSFFRGVPKNHQQDYY